MPPRYTASAPASTAAPLAAEGIEAVLNGTLPSFQADYDGGEAGEVSYSLQVDPLPDGGAVVGAIEQDPSPSATLRNIPLGFKIDAHGRPVWQRSLDVPGAGVQSLVGESDLDAGLVLAGSAGNPAAIARARIRS